MEQLLNRLYYNTETGFLSLDKLYRKAKKQNSKITRRFVQEWLSKQSTGQRTRPRQIKQNLGTIVLPIGGYQADLIFLPKFKRENDGYSTILTLIEVNSREGYAYPLKTKSARSVLDALKRFSQDQKVEKLNTIHTDIGKEFTNKLVQTWFKENGIEHRVSPREQHNHLGIIERFNRTLKQLLIRYRTAKNTNRWIDVLSSFIKNYNSTYHSTIKNEPEEMTLQKQEDFFFNQLFKDFDNRISQINFSSIQRGDLVRIELAKKNIFAKEDVNFSQDIYVVRKVNAKTFRVENLEDPMDTQRIRKDKVLKVNRQTSTRSLRRRS